MVREQQSRKQAETLFATLGAAPSWSQRVAVVLVNKWLWLLGLPFMLAIVVRVANIPERALEHWWEGHRHARLLHVVSPVAAWLLTVGWVSGLMIALLVWSLFGERVDARRDLQAALASKPPTTAGGAASCRHCNAPLVVAPGALGARCEHCGADNLVQIPAEWASRARAIDATMRLDVELARAHAAEGRRRVRHAIAWRVPFVVIALLWVGWPAYNRRHRAGWDDLRFHRENVSGVYLLALHRDHDEPDRELHDIAQCSDTHARGILLHDTKLGTESSQWCDATTCTTAAVFALSAGDHLRLSWVAGDGAATARVALGPDDYLGGVGVLYDGFGDAVVDAPLANGHPGDLALDVAIAISGWYKLDLRGPRGVVVEPCVVLAAK
jgi:hypothetical protein